MQLMHPSMLVAAHLLLCSSLVLLSLTDDAAVCNLRSSDAMGGTCLLKAGHHGDAAVRVADIGSECIHWRQVGGSMLLLYNQKQQIAHDAWLKRGLGGMCAI
jgi:hypothetical protein